jgi:hypothetical protein
MGSGEFELQWLAVGSGLWHTLRMLKFIYRPELHVICRNCGWKFTPETSQSVDRKVAQIVQQYDAHRKDGTCKCEEASLAKASAATPRIVRTGTDFIVVRVSR